ncbi:MAG: hypothetical protein IJJ26_01370 [Victivallales bacterium]|nr:hypothetical protein [Victivallales bacterium]
MTNRKLTLSMPEDVIDKARHLAKQHSTSISELLARYVVMATSLEQRPVDQKTSNPKFGPLTTRILELAGDGVKLPKNWNYKDELMAILEEKYEKNNSQDFS